MSEFAVGEIAIMYLCPRHPERAGEEVEICGLEDWFWVRDLGGSVYGYRAKVGSGVDWVIPREHLRKKRPPQQTDNQTTTWDRCVFKPAGVSA